MWNQERRANDEFVFIANQVITGSEPINVSPVMSRKAGQRSLYPIPTDLPSPQKLSYVMPIAKASRATSPPLPPELVELFPPPLRKLSGEDCSNLAAASRLPQCPRADEKECSHSTHDSHNYDYLSDLVTSDAVKVLVKASSPVPSQARSAATSVAIPLLYNLSSRNRNLSHSDTVKSNSSSSTATSSLSSASSISSSEDATMKFSPAKKTHPVQTPKFARLPVVTSSAKSINANVMTIASSKRNDFSAILARGQNTQIGWNLNEKGYSSPFVSSFRKSTSPIMNESMKIHNHTLKNTNEVSKSRGKASSSFNSVQGTSYTNVTRNSSNTSFVSLNSSRNLNMRKESKFPIESRDSFETERSQEYTCSKNISRTSNRDECIPYSNLNERVTHSTRFSPIPSPHLVHSRVSLSPPLPASPPPLPPSFKTPPEHRRKPLLGKTLPPTSQEVNRSWKKVGLPITKQEKSLKFYSGKVDGASSQETNVDTFSGGDSSPDFGSCGGRVSPIGASLPRDNGKKSEGIYDNLRVSRQELSSEQDRGNSGSYFNQNAKQKKDNLNLSIKSSFVSWRNPCSSVPPQRQLFDRRNVNLISNRPVPVPPRSQSLSPPFRTAPINVSAQFPRRDSADRNREYFHPSPPSSPLAGRKSASPWRGGSLSPPIHGSSPSSDPGGTFGRPPLPRKSSRNPKGSEGNCLGLHPQLLFHDANYHHHPHFGHQNFHQVCQIPEYNLNQTKVSCQCHRCDANHFCSSHVSSNRQHWYPHFVEHGRCGIFIPSASISPFNFASNITNDASFDKQKSNKARNKTTFYRCMKNWLKQT